MTLLPGAEPYAHDAGDVGVLLCHGYLSTPQSMRPWAEHLAAAGFSVRVPLMRGYGTTWQALNRTRWPEWMQTLEEGYADLAARCRLVFVAGLSMGGLTATKLALDHPRTAGVVLVNPMFRHNDPRLRLLPILRFLIPSLGGVAGDIRKPGVHEVALPRNPLQAMYSQTRLWRLVGERLPELTAPVHVFRSVEDHVIPRVSVEYFLRRATNAQVTQTWLNDSYHVATLDHDAPVIFEESVRFIRRHAGG